MRTWRIFCVILLALCLSPSLFGCAEADIGYFAQWETPSKAYEIFSVDPDSLYASGIRDKDGTILVEPCYYVDETNLSYRLSDKDGRDGFLDKQSGHVELPKYDEVRDYFCKDAESPILVRKDGLFGYLNRFDGTVAIPFQYNGESSYGEFYGGYAIAVQALIGDGYYIPQFILIDQTGREIPFPEGVMPVSNVADGRVIVSNTYSIDEIRKEKYGVATPAGEMIVPLQYDDLCAYQNGYAAVKKDDLWGYIDVNGAEILAPCLCLYEGDPGFYFDEDGKAEVVLYNGETVILDARTGETRAL